MIPILRANPSRRAAIVSAGAFDYSTVANLSRWYESTYGVDKDNGAGGFTPVTSDGDTVNRWQDRQGGFHLHIQAIDPFSGNSTYKTGITHSKPALRFSLHGALGDFFRDGNYASLSGDFAVFLAQQSSGDNIVMTGETNRQCRIGESGSNILSMYDGTTDVASSTLSISRSSWSVLSYIRRSGTVYFYENGVAKGNAGGGVWTNTIQFCWLGSPFSGGGDVAALLVYDGNGVSGTDQTNIENQLVADYA